MKKQYASIFNDVLGPVMRGPSSSHTAASARIGKTMRQLIDGEIKDFIIEFDPNGSLATTYHTHFSDIGLEGGILGMEPSDENIVNACEITKSKGINVEYKIVNYSATHPNTYKMTVSNVHGDSICATALSTGGGMIEFVEIEGFSISITGGFYETLLFVDRQNMSNDVYDDCFLENLSNKVKEISDSFQPCDISVIKNDARKNEFLIQTRFETSPSNKLLIALKEMSSVKKVIHLNPCMPIASQLEPKVPFSTPEDMISFAAKNNFDPWQAALSYESARGSISHEETYKKMSDLIDVMENSVENGLNGTIYDNRLLGSQSTYFKDNLKSSRLIGDSLVNEIIRYVSAIMETKSSMGVIVAAPTAGSCGGLPGTVLAVAHQLGLPKEKIIQAMFVAGIIGVFISEKSTFAAEVAGCQAECGAGSGLAAGALVQLMGGNTEEALNAGSMALQNILGMVCDPVAMGVEVPCLGKNIMCGLNALSCANMILVGYDHVLPLSETIDAYDEVGRKIPYELRCTGYGGLSITKTGKELEKKLFG